MSGGVPCRCKPVDRQFWVVTQRQQNVSAFSGYRPTPSDYSEVHCKICLGVWRTKAKYVADLPNGSLQR